MAEMSRALIEAGLRWRYTPQRMAALMSDADTVALVAHDATRIQGFAVMRFGDLHGHLMLLCVRPEQQQQGLGRRLVEWLIASARIAGLDQIRLELRADNAAALAFYRRLGFGETELVAGYYSSRLPARRMTLPLRSGA